MRITNNFYKPNFTALNAPYVRNVTPELRTVAQELIKSVEASDEIRRLTSGEEVFDVDISFEQRKSYDRKKLRACVNLISGNKIYNYSCAIDDAKRSLPDDYAARALAIYFSPHFNKWVEKSKAMEQKVYTSDREISAGCDYTEFKLNPTALYNIYYSANMK